jgi:hypothetical protein
LQVVARRGESCPASAPPSWGHPRNSRVSVLPRHGQPRWNRLSSSAAVARRGSANWANFSLLPTTQCGPHQGRTSRSAPWCAMANSWRVNARKVLGRPACPASLILGRQTAQPAGVAAPQPTEHRPGCRQAVDSGSRRQISLAVAPLRGGAQLRGVDSPVARRRVTRDETVGCRIVGRERRQRPAPFRQSRQRLSLSFLSISPCSGSRLVSSRPGLKVDPGWRWYASSRRYTSLNAARRRSTSRTGRRKTRLGPGAPVLW